jgi:hypothetical protein
VNERINLGGIQSDERECLAMNLDEKLGIFVGTRYSGYRVVGAATAMIQLDRPTSNRPNTFGIRDSAHHDHLCGGC